jgi:hypothetical protein
MKARFLLAPAALALATVARAAAPASPLEWFQRLDRDGDGKLSREEVAALPRLRAGFDTLDTDRDGLVSPEELRAAAARAWQPPPNGPAAPATAPQPSASPTRGPATVPPTAIIDPHSPQFRGPRGDGVAYGSNLPDAWSDTNNVVWSCPIPGKGWSSPIVWGERVFVTSAVGAGPVEPPPAKLGSVAEHVRGVTSTDRHQYLVHCVDWRNGQLLWSRVAHEGVPPGPIHPKGSYASETPVADGERVYAYFGGVGLYCYDLDGRQLWSRQWGSFKMDWNWGTSASPVLHGDRLFVLNDNQEASFLAALDKRTGKDVWRVSRAEKSNWSSPFVWEHDGGAELVTAGSGRVRSYDLDGKVLWELRGMSSVTVRTPFAAEGLLYLASGNTGSPNKPVYAIRPGARGDVSLPADSTSNAHIAWSRRKAAPYVVAAGRAFRVLHVNRLGESTLATPAVARDSVILRTLTQLHRIASVAEVSRDQP